MFNIQAKFEVCSFSRSQDMRRGLCLFTSGVVCRLVFVSHEYSVRKVNTSGISLVLNYSISYWRDYSALLIVTVIFAITLFVCVFLPFW